LFDIGWEDIAVGGLLDGHRSLDAAESHRRQDGQDLSLATGHRFVAAASSDAARV
jgi:hypothetical protein